MHLGILKYFESKPWSKDGVVDLENLKKICANSLGERPPEDRFIVWLCLLGIMPKKVEKWKEILDEIYTTYIDFMKLFGVEDWTTKRFSSNYHKEDFELEDNNLMNIIYKDIARTSHHIFFLPPAEVVEEPVGEPSDEDILIPFVTHMRRLERILYIFANINRTMSYVQGFNELLPILYFVFLQASHLFGDDMIMVEALSFKGLMQLIMSTELHELYTTVDQSSIIIHNLKSFEEIFKVHAPLQYKITQAHQLQPLLYCYRWFTLLFAQEYDIPDLLIIWDSLFAHISDLINFEFYVGVATIKANASKLDLNNFSVTMTALQTMCVSNVYPVIKAANEMYKNDHPDEN